jgi:hypothetical protein
LEILTKLWVKLVSFLGEKLLFNIYYYLIILIAGKETITQKAGLFIL